MERIKFCCIIPDRGDRPELTQHCFAMLDRMTVKPDKIYHVNHQPQSEGYDLTKRIKIGANLAKEDGFDWCFIIENDDYYPEDYFSRFIPFMDKNDIIGEEQSIYYNLRNLTFKTLEHKWRSSLFTTAFRISALNNFDWAKAHNLFIDIDIWKYARFKRRMFIKTGAIGIKHNLGLCGGKGHVMKMGNYDQDMKWLEGKVDENSIEFYRSLVERFKRKAA